VYVYVSMRRCICVHVCAYVYAHVYVYVQCKHICVCMRVYMYKPVCDTYMYMYTYSNDKSSLNLVDFKQNGRVKGVYCLTFLSEALESTKNCWQRTSSMGWIRLVCSLKIKGLFCKRTLLKRDYILHKRPIISRSLLSVATP